MGAVARDAFRFPSPLIEPDVPVARIRLSDRIHSRLTDGPLGVSPDAGRLVDQRWLDPAPGADADLGGACSEKIERDRRRGGQPIYGGQSIPEESGAKATERERPPEPGQPGPVARGARPAPPQGARLVELHPLRDPAAGLSG
jgi:hypothetical protein